MMAGLLSAFSNCGMAPQALLDSIHAAAWQPALHGNGKLGCALQCALGMPCTAAVSMLYHLNIHVVVTCTLHQPNKQLFTATCLLHIGYSTWQGDTCPQSCVWHQPLHHMGLLMRHPVRSALHHILLQTYSCLLHEMQ